MKTFHDIWSKLCGKTPGLADPDAKIEFKASELQKFAKQFFDKGRQFEHSQSSKVPEGFVLVLETTTKEKDPLEKMFDDMFKPSLN